MDDPKFNNDSPGDPQAETGAISKVRYIARRGRLRLTGALRSGIDEFGDTLRARLLQMLSTPEQVEVVQQALANLSQWTISQGFRADPNAELLFDFVDWLEEHNDRQAVTILLLNSPMLRDPAFLDALAHLSKVLNPWEEPDENENWNLSQIERFKDRAGSRLLDLLIELAALEADDRPPGNATVEKRIEYFQSAPIPLRFTRLAAMTQGDHLIRRRPPSRRLRWLKKVADRFSATATSDSALTRFLPGVGDKRLHFLIFSTTFFFQSYLLRNLIEALPDLAEELGQSIADDDVIDLD